MKKILLFLSFALWCFSTYSQNISASVITDSVYLSNPDIYLSQINTSNVNTGVLIDRDIYSSLLLNINGYDKVTTITYKEWKDIYKNFSATNYDSLAILKLDTIRYFKDLIYQNEKCFPVGIIDCKFNRIKQSAIDNQEFSIGSMYLLDNSATTNSFSNERAVAISCLQNTIFGDDVNFLFSKFFFVSNIVTDSLISIEMDFGNGEGFNYNFDEINFKVDSISSVEDWVKAYSTMRLNKRGKLKAELGINPSDPFELKVNYVVTNFQLSDFDLYSKYYVGFPILLGNLYWQGKTNITARQLTGENKLIIRNAKLGKKSGGLMNVPLKLALYILKDVNGDIILNIPLAGDMNNPKTKIGKLVWQTVKNLIVKVAASPFKALSGLLGVDPDDLKGIQFNYTDTTITDTHLRRIKQFIVVEKKKPDMKIELFYYNDVDLEKREIAVAEAGKLFNIATGGDYIKDKAQFTSFIAKKLQSDTVNMIAGSVRLIGNQKLDSIQGSYSKKRISEIEAALYNAENATKIKIFIPDKDMPENVGSRPVFELKYSTD